MKCDIYVYPVEESGKQAPVFICSQGTDHGLALTASNPHTEIRRFNLKALWLIE